MPQIPTSQILHQAIELLRTKGWTQGSYARDAGGLRTDTHGLDATCFCALGAIKRVCGSKRDIKYVNILHDTIIRELVAQRLPSSVIDWNDAPDQTAPQVITWLESFATKLEAPLS